MSEQYPQLLMRRSPQRYRGYDGRRQDGGAMLTPGTATAFSPGEDLTVYWNPGDPLDLIPDQMPVLWQGSVAASLGSGVRYADLVPNRLVVFTVKGSKVLFVAPESAWQTIVSSVDAGRLIYSPRSWWRRSQFRVGAAPVVVVSDCVPWLVGRGVDPYVEVLNKADTTGYPRFHFGPDGTMYLMGPSPSHPTYGAIFTLADSGAITLLVDLYPDCVLASQLNLGFDFTTPLYYADFVVTASEIYFSSPSQMVIRRCSLGGSGRTVIAGTGAPTSFSGFHGNQAYDGDGVATDHKLNNPTTLFLSAGGSRLLFCDTRNGMIRQVDLNSAQLTTVIGGVNASDPTHPWPAQGDVDGDGVWYPFVNGAGGSATGVGAYVLYPTGVWEAPNGDVYASESILSNVCRKDHATGALVNVQGDPGAQDITSTGGDSTYFFKVGFPCPGVAIASAGPGDYAVALDGAGVRYNYMCNHLMRNGVPVTSVSPFTPSLASGGGPLGGSALIYNYAFDADGIVYANLGTFVIRFVCPPPCLDNSAVITTIAGKTFALGDNPCVDGPLGTNTIGFVAAMAINPLDRCLWFIQLENGDVSGGQDSADPLFSFGPPSMDLDITSHGAGGLPQLRKYDPATGIVTTIYNPLPGIAEPSLASWYNSGASMAFSVNGDLFIVLNKDASNPGGGRIYRSRHSVVYRLRHGNTTLEHIAGQDPVTCSSLPIPAPSTFPCDATSLYLGAGATVSMSPGAIWPYTWGSVGDLYISDPDSMRVYAISTGGGSSSTTVYAGNGSRADWSLGTQSTDSGGATSTPIGSMGQISVQADGRMLIPSGPSDCIYEVSDDGSTVTALTNHVAAHTPVGEYDGALFGTFPENDQVVRGAGAPAWTQHDPTRRTNFGAPYSVVSDFCFPVLFTSAGSGLLAIDHDGNLQVVRTASSGDPAPYTLLPRQGGGVYAASVRSTTGGFLYTLTG